MTRRGELRSGYTTGACAAAAAKAATISLLKQRIVTRVGLDLPGAKRASFAVRRCVLDASQASCSVIKDAGDDPDVTDGAEIRATVSWREEPGIGIAGGEGVGVVTKPGLEIPVGAAAINPVPRQMIASAVGEAAGTRLDGRGLSVVISVLDGEKLGRRTLNRRLGIVGGISIIGTTGIVIPYSVSAYTACISRALDVAVACGCRQAVLTTGRRSEKFAQVELALSALLSQGHMLVEDVPGVGKTILTKALAKSVGCSFRRIQCTPDLLPSDIIGASIYNQKTGEFEFRPGPIMAQIVLVDEINRASPRTQAAFIECMEERQVTIDGVTKSLTKPFFVIATQNPIEIQGTFPLPEAQLDRFLLKVKLGYPTQEEETTILQRFQHENPLDRLTSVLEARELLELQRLCREVFVEESVRNYIVAIARATRSHESIKLGASPRSSLGLHLASQALAAIRGRSFVIPDDVKYLVVPALAHRLMAKTEAQLKGRSVEDLVAEIVSTVPVPVE